MSSAPREPELTWLEASDGARVPLRCHHAETPGAALLFLPALGVRAAIYDGFASQLATAGVECWVMEQRGHGDSPLRASSRHRWRFADILDRDLPPALDALRSRCSGLPLLLGGHSLGGHFATIHAGRDPQGLDGILHVACGFPYHGDYPKKQASMVRWLCRLIPMFNFYPGYYPGRLLGCGERESLGLMHNWSEWAMSGSFDFDGQRGVAEAAGRFTGPVLAIALDEDDLVTEASLQRAISPLAGAKISRCTLGAAEQGEFRGHTTWTRASDGVVDRVRSWIHDSVTG